MTISAGFKATAFNYQFETAIVIDCANRFLSKWNCLEEIDYIMEDPNLKLADKRRQIVEKF